MYIDYMCSVAVGEQISEEEESGVDEDDQTASALQDAKLKRKKSGTKNRNAQQTKTVLQRLL